MIIIGISGKKHSGKTTIANHIKSLYPNKVFDIAFADALKDEVCEWLGINRAILETNKELLRLILQGLGSWRRYKDGEDCWIRKCFGKINRLPIDSIVVIPDVRHVNEAHRISDVGGILWRVNRLECDIDDQHESETSLDSYTGWNATISNNETLEMLKAQINNLVIMQNIK